MKSNLHKLLLTFFLVVSIITAPPSTAGKMASENGEVDKEINGKKSIFKIPSLDSFDKVMGAEECVYGDEECLMRRAVLEAHLDYIYTQKSVP